jgi:hypothetical protein
MPAPYADPAVYTPAALREQLRSLPRFRLSDGTIYMAIGAGAL